MKHLIYILLFLFSLPALAQKKVTLYVATSGVDSVTYANDTVYVKYKSGTTVKYEIVAGSTGVTSIATNNGTGITGGTITSTGTLSLDTLIVGTRAWRDKLADSLGALIGAKMANPMTTSGDIIYGGASGTPTRLGIGSTSQVLTVAGGVPTWATPSGGGGSPAGSTGEIQYNNAGAFAASSSLFFDNSNIRLGVGTIQPNKVFSVYDNTSYQAKYTNSSSASGSSAGFILNTKRGGDFGWAIGFRTNQDNGWFEMTAGDTSNPTTIYRRWFEYSDLMASSATIGWTNSAPITGVGLANRETYIGRQVAGRLRITSTATEAGLEFAESGGYIMGIRTSSANAAWMEMHNNNTVKSRWVDFEYVLGSSGQLGFAPNNFTGTGVSSRDVGIKRNAAGVIEINSGTAGTYRDLLLRSISPGGESMAIGSTTTAASAVVAVNSTSKGFLPPRMTTTQKNAIGSPTAGLVVYDTTLNKLCVYTGSAWETITSL